ncbi:MAG TPA: amidohydrolase, partial [Terriglobales bacterium]
MKRLVTLLLLFVAASFAQTPQFAPTVRAYVKYDQPTIALTHVRVIDGTGAPARENQTVVLSGGKIQSVGEAAPPAAAQVIDLTG